MFAPFDGDFIVFEEKRAAGELFVNFRLVVVTFVFFIKFINHASDQFSYFILIERFTLGVEQQTPLEKS